MINSYSFDQRINRTHTDSVKWDKVTELFGSPDVLPLWVADMDFASPPAVIEALTQRAQFGVPGYTLISEQYFRSVIDWVNRRHHWEIKKEWISYCPGIVTALSILVDVLSIPGDQVIIQPPVYTPFFNVISKNGREVREVPLSFNGVQYQMDFDLLEEAMKTSKLMILCSPHNPVGRVWSKDELQKLAELSLKYQVQVISDEIHCDMVFKGSGTRHIPFGMLSEEISHQSITCVAPSKTFNLAGLKTASIIIPNPDIRKLFDQRMQILALGLESYFGAAAVQAAYNEGEDWLEELLDYLEGNLQFLDDFLKQNLPMIKLIKPQGTYLAWLDFRELNKKQNELREILTQKAKVGLSDGISYGRQGVGFMRMNLACPRSILEEALLRIQHAFSA